MKRSEINAKLRDAEKFFAEMKFILPPWATWRREQWLENWGQSSEIRDNTLGWDLTDFGSGEFAKMGLLLFTLRNGNYHNSAYPKPYAEKIMIVEEGQVTPMHYHWKKMEDIINRGGGNLLVQLFNAASDDSLGNTEVDVSLDGLRRRLPAGSIVTLEPGQSITLTTKLYHSFWGEPGSGRVLVGEVSMVNDDANDNKFYEECGRFPAIEEDEAPLYPLCTEYSRLAKAGDSI